MPISPETAPLCIAGHVETKVKNFRRGKEIASWIKDHSYTFSEHLAALDGMIHIINEVNSENIPSRLVALTGLKEQLSGQRLPSISYILEEEEKPAKLLSQNLQEMDKQLIRGVRKKSSKKKLTFPNTDAEAIAVAGLLVGYEMILPSIHKRFRSLPRFLVTTALIDVLSEIPEYSMYSAVFDPNRLAGLVPQKYRNENISVTSQNFPIIEELSKEPKVQSKANVHPIECYILLETLVLKYRSLERPEDEDEFLDFAADTMAIIRQWGGIENIDNWLKRYFPKAHLLSSINNISDDLEKITSLLED